jgi:hypothetical protein
MRFVLCSKQTYKEQYQEEAHRWIHVVDHKDLLGFKDVHVNVHDCWMYEINDERVDYLEQQLTALADFGYIKITYIQEDGWEENYEPEVLTPIGLQSEMSPSPSTSSGTVVYETVDNSCESGACAI